MPNVEKAYELRDAHIQFVSLVDKAANKKQFLITKSENGQAGFQTYGRILKADAETHQVTGIVYEPMAEDTQGEFMTAEEIEKAAHWFMKNSNSVDLQHSFEPLEGAAVVESWVAKSDEDIGGETVKAGTWLMTVEISNPEIYEAVEKGEITGFSMGGMATHCEDDVTLPDDEPAPITKKEGKGLLKKFASLLGLDVVEKGAVKDEYDRRVIRDNFWTAFYTLADALLDKWDPITGDYIGLETDETAINNALTDFNEIVVELLSGSEPVTVTLSAEPAEGSANVEFIKSLHGKLDGILAQTNSEEEVTDVTKSELEEIVTGAVQKAMQPDEPDVEGADVQKNEEGAEATANQITPEEIQKMVEEAVEKASQPKDEPMTKEEIQKCIDESVAKAMEPVLKSTGLPTNLNGDEPVQKEEKPQHYLHGIL